MSLGRYRGDGYRAVKLCKGEWLTHRLFCVFTVLSADGICLNSLPLYLALWLRWKFFLVLIQWHKHVIVKCMMQGFELFLGSILLISWSMRIPIDFWYSYSSYYELSILRLINLSILHGGDILWKISLSKRLFIRFGLAHILRFR